MKKNIVKILIVALLISCFMPSVASAKSKRIVRYGKIKSTFERTTEYDNGYIFKMHGLEIDARGCLWEYFLSNREFRNKKFKSGDKVKIVFLTCDTKTKYDDIIFTVSKSK